MAIIFRHTPRALRLVALALATGARAISVAGISGAPRHLPRAPAQRAQALQSAEAAGGRSSSPGGLRMVSTASNSDTDAPAQGAPAPGTGEGKGEAAVGTGYQHGARLSCAEQLALDHKMLSSGVIARREEMLATSYEMCREITEQYSKTFYMGTRLFPPEKARARPQPVTRRCAGGEGREGMSEPKLMAVERAGDCGAHRVSTARRSELQRAHAGHRARPVAPPLAPPLVPAFLRAGPGAA